MAQTDMTQEQSTTVGPFSETDLWWNKYLMTVQKVDDAWNSYNQAVFEAEQAWSKFKQWGLNAERGNIGRAKQAAAAAWESYAK